MLYQYITRRQPEHHYFYVKMKLSYVVELLQAEESFLKAFFIPPYASVWKLSESQALLLLSKNGVRLHRCAELKAGIGQ